MRGVWKEEKQHCLGKQGLHHLEYTKLNPYVTFSFSSAPFVSLFLCKYHSYMHKQQKHLHIKLRNTKAILIPKPNLTFYSQTFNFTVPQIFNNQLPNNITAGKNHTQF